MRTSELSLREVDTLFTPFIHRKLQLPTRLVMAPVPRLFAQNGIPTPEMLMYYKRRAANMMGLIITEPVAVNDPAAAADSGMAQFYGGAALRAWKGICRAVHTTSCRIMPQLNHVGMLRPSAGDLPNPDAPAIGPSGIIPGNLEMRGEPMSRERIKSVVAAFASAAAAAKLIGFDGVEINGAHACLVEQFLRKETNRRTDEYGGDITSRTRFAVQIVQAVRKSVGRSFPIIFRYSQFGSGVWNAPLLESPAVMEEFLQPLCDAGVDIFACDGIDSPAFHGSALNLAGWTRLLTHRPVIASGGVGMPGKKILPHIHRLRTHEFDLMAVGRALLADAEWGSKVRLARDEEIFPFSPRAWLHLY